MPALNVEEPARIRMVHHAKGGSVRRFDALESSLNPHPEGPLPPGRAYPVGDRVRSGQEIGTEGDSADLSLGKALKVLRWVQGWNS